SRIEKQFALPLMRQEKVETMVSLTKALADGGLPIVEITLMTSAAFDAIAKLAKEKDLIVGAGTVRNLGEAQQALDSGAKFLVSPGLDEEVLAFAERNDILYLPGVLTPTEIMRASAIGAEAVKVFPISNVGGPDYIKALSGPFPEMKWCVTGGVSVANAKAYLKAGASAVGLGSQLLPNELIGKKKWKEITLEAKRCVKAVASMRKPARK
ncbi:MAG TPA: bifunctional 4-hydroxy-2-oxoglutarate aldolase/2-dehydro-3-deoxy-phosphogluconate aldolase, partial [Bdellovibrionales bacterium]|nr:bifunctional 4-hydroxy-2-oxoglutarate aldolase/2-dehydro-3-deoxy-phosphogluconate aldolase [Bdellovibrionales bacterium]